MSGSKDSQGVVSSRFFYGWVIVAVSMIMWAVSTGVMNSFGVFFKPLAADFGWSRSATSTIQSFYFISMGVFTIGWAWLADRFGPTRIVSIGGLLAGLGLILTSQVSALWQIYLTYSLLTGLSMSSILPVANTTTARWFVERRGLALGIVASGAGLGTMLAPPIAARLIVAFGWSTAYLVFGIITGVVVVVGACLMKRSPEAVGLRPYGVKASLPGTGLAADPPPAVRTARPARKADATVRAALRSWTLWTLVGVFTMFTFCNQMTVVHLVNYATDVGIAPLVAATLLSGIGLSNMGGRILMGLASDRIGNLNTVVLSCIGIAATLLFLGFATDLWMFGIFTVVYGFAHGAEVPQQPALIGKFFGLRTVLVAILQSGSMLGAALGAWLGGQVFDLTQSYKMAFLIAVAAIGVALVAALILRGREPKPVSTRVPA